jgi:long-chain acyl-CoA synthetase
VNSTVAVVMDGEFTEKPEGLNVLTWEQLLAKGAEYVAEHAGEVLQISNTLKGNDLATIVYTSGTTGVPKGAMIPHSNIYFVCGTLAAAVGFSSEDMSLSFLPLSHIFERIGGQFLHIHQGIAIAFAESMDTVGDNMVEIRPTIMNAVPRFYEKAYNRIQSQIRSMPAPQQVLIRWALSIGRRALKSQEAHKDGNGGIHDLSTRIYRTELRVADRIVFSKIRQRFGGRLRFLVSGAAPLSSEVQQFFEILGLPILEGYGLTETTAPVACNKPGTAIRGTVGQALPGVDLKIAEDGEIMVRGPNVFSGYYKNEEATREAFRDGWFLTGDIGEIDQAGYLRIKDRKKDIIITAGGKHVAPQVIENMLAGQGLISRIVVYGDRRKHIVALITPNLDEVKAFAANSLATLSIEELVRHPAVRGQFQVLIDAANAKLASFEQIKRFLVLPNDFTIEANELTPTLKIRRKFVSEKYKELLDGLYNVEDIAVEKGLVS